MTAPEPLCLVEASIADLRHALDSRAITSVELVALYLHRIGRFDYRGPSLNSVCVLNPEALQEAKASDDYRASGRAPRPLEGIPFTVKDSFLVKGMTAAAGSPAFRDLVSSRDAAIVASLRAAGAIVLGKTNMPAMADGGCQRGLYGRAESPYNLEYSTTAYASGSSNGCGTATAASFASFGFAGETVSSGRSPASNNALVGYSPSRGVIPNSGQWPLYPTCDVIVPHTRSVQDLFDVLNVIVAEDRPAENGVDLWRSQKTISTPKYSEVRPLDYHSLEDPGFLRGKRIAVPLSFLGQGSSVVCSDDILALWNSNVTPRLEALGATVVETTDFPLYDQYTRQDFPGQSANVPGLTQEWNSFERCELIALAWDDFLRDNADPKYPTLQAADPDQMKPLIAPMDDPALHSEAQNQVRYPDMIDAVRVRTHTIVESPGLQTALEALENMRKAELEGWMSKNSFDLIAFPTNGDVAYADSDESREHMLHALRDGVKYSNGGRALKHLGVPCITLPMGAIPSTWMPVGVTFCARGFADSDLLRAAYAFDTAAKLRTVPDLTPAIPSDYIDLVDKTRNLSPTGKPVLTAKLLTSARSSTEEEEIRDVEFSGTLVSSDPETAIASLDVLVNGESAVEPVLNGEQWTWKATLRTPKRVERFPPLAPIPRDHFMVVFVAKTSNGRASAVMKLVD